MIQLKTSSRVPSTLALSLSLAVYCAGQASLPAPGNPRSGPDDPRIGLKAGLYDAGEAASGLQLVATLPKPPGFAPIKPDPNAPVPKAGTPEALALARNQYVS